MEQCEVFRFFVPHILSLPNRPRFAERDLKNPRFLLYRGEDVEIYYAPFDYINTKAKVIIVGITPGWKQMQISFAVAKDGLQKGLSLSQVLANVKRKASFAGTMRRNLVEMLDGLGISAALGIPSTASLFDDHYDLLHATSVIRYPVFVKGRNYTGYTPSLHKTPVLYGYIRYVLAKELRMVRHALVVPLGTSVSEALQMLICEGLLERRRCLLGFPHPSGANGHRIRQYAERRKHLEGIVSAWFSSNKDSL